MTEAEKAAALADAWSGTPTPYAQIRDTFGPEVGQYDFVVKSLTPKFDDDGCYFIEGEFGIVQPSMLASAPAWKRSLYVGTKRVGKNGAQPDPLAKLPETRLNAQGLRFLKKIGKAAGVTIPENAPDSQFCGALIGKLFGCPVIAGKPYKDRQTGEEKPGGNEFGNNVTTAGTVPATGPFRAQAMNGASPAPVTGAAAGAQFHAE